eukprot:m.1316804 g.1316804  ORF g.1316804 m.1316804 type:complete len:1311 (-) comp24838_c0_seq4:118-4050(-)
MRCLPVRLPFSSHSPTRQLSQIPISLLVLTVLTRMKSIPTMLKVTIVSIVVIFVLFGICVGQSSIVETTPDTREPHTQCPLATLQSAAVFHPSSGNGKKEITCTVVFLNSSDPFPPPGSGCIVYARDSHRVEIVEIQNSDRTTLYETLHATEGARQTTTFSIENLRTFYTLVEISFVASDVAGSSATCSVLFNVSMTSEDVLRTSVLNIDKLTNGSFVLPSTGEGTSNLCLSVKNAGLLVHYTNSSFIDSIAMAMLRLARFVHDLEVSVAMSCRFSLSTAATAISGKLAAVHSVPQDTSCGDSVCDASEESCFSCPSDCGVVGSFSSSPCATTIAFVLDSSGIVSYSVPPESPISTTANPVVVHSHWGPLPFFFGPVTIRFDVVGGTSVGSRYVLAVSGLSDSSHPNTVNPFVVKPPNHAFGGVSFTLSYFAAQSGAVQPQLRAYLNLSSWGRHQLTSSSQLSVWYYSPARSTWVHCAGESYFSPSTMQYDPFLTACVSGWPRDVVRQFAMFIDESNMPFASVEGAIASTLGNAIVQAPTLQTLSDPGLSAAVDRLNKYIYDAIPQVLGLFANRYNVTRLNSGSLQYVGDNISMTVVVAPFSQLQGKTFEAFGTSSTQQIQVSLPSAIDWVYGGSAHTALTLGVALMENPVLDEDILLADHLYSNRVVTVILQELSAADTSGAVPIVINATSFVNVSFTEDNALAYPVGGVSRQCVVLDDTAFGQYLDANTTVITYTGSPFGVQTHCGFRNAQTVAYRQLVPTTTTTATSTTTSQTETINTASPTIATTTYMSTENRDEVVFLGQQSLRATASDATHSSWIILYVVFFLVLLIALFERRRYIQKYVNYERNISDAGLVSRIPMSTERDLLTQPISGCFKLLCCLRCPVILARLCVVRHALSAMFCFRCQCCSTAVYPDRLSRLAYVALVVSAGMGVCATFSLLADAGESDLPSSWVDDAADALGISITDHDQRTRISNGNESVVYVTTMERTITNTRIIVNGIVDGFWACCFILPVVLLTSYALNKRGAYIDVIRILAPIRFRSTHSEAFRIMKLRGIPVQYWVDRARGKNNDVVVSKAEIRIQPKDDVTVHGFGGVSNSTARAISTKPPTTTNSAFTPSDFFENGYLAIDPNPEVAADDVVPRTADRALGWGEDSLIEEGISGAGLALPKSPDADSLLDLEHDVTYEPQFTPEIELLITLARRWGNLALFCVLVAIFYGTLASAVLLWGNSDLTDDKVDRFYTAATTCVVMSHLTRKFCIDEITCSCICYADFISLSCQPGADILRSQSNLFNGTFCMVRMWCTVHQRL